MTPFGAKIRDLRAKKNVSARQMAADLHVSPAYLSALEHGNRGRPSPGFVMQIIGYFNIIWDEAEELKRLAELSHPRITIDTAGLAPEATELANRLAESIRDLDSATLHKLLELVRENS